MTKLIKWVQNKLHEYVFSHSRVSSSSLIDGVFSYLSKVRYLQKVDGSSDNVLKILNDRYLINPPPISIIRSLSAAIKNSMVRLRKDNFLSNFMKEQLLKLCPCVK